MLFNVQQNQVTPAVTTIVDTQGNADRTQSLWNIHKLASREKTQPKIGLRHCYFPIKLITKIKRATFCNYEETGTLKCHSVAVNGLDK